MSGLNEIYDSMQNPMKNPKQVRNNGMGMQR